ncbi:MAG TPA: cobalamin-dependent protein, partial [Candidatus Ozemobacteraceae bacterium]|nr:cobalamin-dependent protein [Candidatus Ozemobacteraceae bacterium]
MTADITLLNLNLLYVRYLDTVDRELHLPLGCLYLTRALEQAGYTVDFRDYQLTQAAEPFSTGAILRFLEGAAPVVGFSCMANLLPFAILAMQEYKKQHPESTLVLGGVGSKAVEEQILERFPWIDVIAVGEGERTGPDLLGAIRRGDDLTRVAGLVVRDRDGRIVRTPTRERVADLD